MKTLNVLIFVMVVTAGTSFFFQSCAPVKNGSTPPQNSTDLPRDVAIPPSSFRCEATVLSTDTVAIIIKIDKMIQQGSSLFYMLGSGDTIEVKNNSPEKENIAAGSAFEVVIEERLKLNSDKPDFILLQVLKKKN